MKRNSLGDEDGVLPCRLIMRTQAAKRLRSITDRSVREEPTRTGETFVETDKFERMSWEPPKHPIKPGVLTLGGRPLRDQRYRNNSNGGALPQTEWAKRLAERLKSHGSAGAAPCHHLILPLMSVLGRSPSHSGVVVHPSAPSAGPESPRSEGSTTDDGNPNEANKLKMNARSQTGEGSDLACVFASASAPGSDMDEILLSKLTFESTTSPKGSACQGDGSGMPQVPVQSPGKADVRDCPRQSWAQRALLSWYSQKRAAQLVVFGAQSKSLPHSARPVVASGPKLFGVILRSECHTVKEGEERLVDSSSSTPQDVG